MGDAGAKRDRVTILQPTTTRDAVYNGAKKTFTAFRNTWGRVEDVVDRNSEETNDRTRKNVRRRKVTIPYQPGILSTMRITLNGDAIEYDIVNIADLGYRDDIVLTVEEYRS